MNSCLQRTFLGTLKCMFPKISPKINLHSFTISIFFSFSHYVHFELFHSECTTPKQNRWGIHISQGQPRTSPKQSSHTSLSLVTCQHTFKPNLFKSFNTISQYQFRFLWKTFPAYKTIGSVWTHSWKKQIISTIKDF